MIRNITYKNQLFAIIINKKYLGLKGVNFFTKPNFNLQVGYLNHPKNLKIQPHSHKKGIRKIKGTTEVLFIVDGILKINFYNVKKKYVFSRLAKKNDIIILLSGGHGFEILKSCKLLEVKQGPYVESLDKNKF